MKLKIKLRISINNLSNLLLYSFFLMTAVIFLYSFNSSMYNLRFGLMATGALFGFFYCFYGFRKFYYAPLLTVTLFLCWVICVLGQRGYLNYSLTYMLYTLAYIGLSIIILKNKYSHIMAVLLYAFSVLTVFVRLLLNTNVNRIMLATSRNYISVLLLLSLLFYYISCHDKRKPVYLFPVILYFYVSVFAIGRGGIISSGFLVLGISLYKVAHVKSKKARIALWSFIVFFIVTGILIILNIDETTINLFLYRYFSGFVQKDLSDEPRIIIWTSFLQNNRASISKFLLGSDVKLVRVEGNLHNSFLQSYSAFGLVGFVTICGLIVRSMFNGIKHKDYLWVILFAGLLLRAFTDTIFFQGYCEVLLYYFIFYWDYQKRSTIAQLAIGNSVDISSRTHVVTY